MFALIATEDFYLPNPLRYFPAKFDTAFPAQFGELGMRETALFRNRSGKIVDDIAIIGAKFVFLDTGFKFCL
jgi:hypothetical protein